MMIPFLTHFVFSVLVSFFLFFLVGGFSKGKPRKAIWGTALISVVLSLTYLLVMPFLPSTQTRLAQVREIWDAFIFSLLVGGVPEESLKTAAFLIGYFSFRKTLLKRSDTIRLAMASAIVFGLME